MRVRRISGVLTVAALALLAAACTLPGAKLDDRALAKVGPEGRQE